MMRTPLTRLAIVAGLTLATLSAAHAETQTQRLQRLAQDGVLQAKIDLAEEYRYGINVKQDKAKAAHWYEQAAKGGDRDSKRHYADMLARGDGVKVDMEKAIFWYEQAAKDGDVMAPYALSEIYRKGVGVPRNPALSVAWVVIAKEVGYPGAGPLLHAMTTQMDPDVVARGQELARDLP